MVTFFWLLFVGVLLPNLKITSADGHVNIQVRILSYDNPLGTSYNGSDFTSQRKCCDSGRNISACSTTDACDSSFIICIGGVSNGYCIGPHSTSSILSNSNSFTTSYDNSIIYSFVWDHWNSGAIDYMFNVMDNDQSGGQELIENFTSSAALRVDSTYEESTSQIVSYKNFISLDIGIRIWCQDGYTGSDCSRQCTNMTYRTCSKNQGSVLLPSCKDTGVSRLPTLSGSSLPLDFTPVHLQQLLFNFVLHEFCPEAEKVNVTILHFTLNGAIEFKATCNETEVDNLLFTTHIYVLSLTDKTSLSRYFPNIQFTQPAVKQISLRGAHVFMMVNVDEYQDTSSACRNHACTVEISICLHTNKAGCERNVIMQSTMHGTCLVICGGQLVDPSSSTTGQFLIGLSTIPVINVDVKYNGNMNWQVHNQTIDSYTVDSTYKKAKPRKMTFSSSHGKTLTLEFLMWCAAGWSGNHCQHSCHSTSNKECNADGHLVCREGYHRSSCGDINECNHNPCKNGGSCQNTPGSFTCQCSTGWTGPTCEVDVDECNLGYCQNASSCTNSPGSFHCRCTHGFRGRTCKDNNECKAPVILCKHGGLCLNKYGSYSCVCAEGFTGGTCDDDIDECAQSICNKNNTVSCNNSVGDYSCNCKNGWTGKTCETDIDECQSKPCFHGTCKNFPGNYTCSCYSGYDGRNCENDLNECLIVHCANNGTCVNLPYPERYRCDCLEGWNPKSRCFHSTDPCITFRPCVHGNCTNKNGNYICTCDDGWEGRNCSTDIDECKLSSCKNNGSCSNTQGSYTCSCLPGWTDLNCSTDIDECNSSPCKNNGSCSNNRGSYTCSCPPEWTGLNCDNDINECKSLPCKNNGNCKNTKGSFLCLCPQNWTGTYCETDVNECNLQPCKNNGTCIHFRGSFHCSCTEGWESKNCEVDIDECIVAVSPCDKTSTCINTNGSYECIYDSSTLSIPVTKHLTETKKIEITSQYHDLVTTESQRKADDLTTYLSTDNNSSRTKSASLSTVSQSERKPVSPTEGPKLFSRTEKTSVTYSRSGYLPSVQSTQSVSTISASKDTKTRANSSTQHSYFDINSTSLHTTAASKISAATQASTTKATNYDKLEEAIYPRCTNSGWNVTLNISMLKEIYPAISSNHIYFGDSSCLGRLKGDLLIFQQGFRECLTSERISGTTILYENDLYYAIYDPINPFIIRQHKWTYTVECDVSRNEATSSHVHHDIEAHHTAVYGHYNISMMFYKDPGYMQQMTGNPLHVNVGDQVYVKVVTSASDWSIKMRMHTCYTKPTDAADNMIFYIIKDGCEVDSNTHIISQSTHETRFVFQDFEYSTNREGLNIYCNATFCETQDYSQGCAQSCVLPGTP